MDATLKNPRYVSFNSPLSFSPEKFAILPLQPPLPFSLKRDRNGMLYIVKSLYIRSYDLLSLSFPLISNKFEFRILEEIYYIYMEE